MTQTKSERMKQFWVDRKAQGLGSMRKRIEGNGSVHSPKAEIIPLQDGLVYLDINKKLDAILDVLTQLVPMIRIEQPEQIDIFNDLKERLKNPRIKELKMSPEQLFKRIGAKSPETVVVDNRAYWDELNFRTIKYFMEKE